MPNYTAIIPQILDHDSDNPQAQKYPLGAPHHSPIHHRIHPWAQIGTAGPHIDQLFGEWRSPKRWDEVMLSVTLTMQETYTRVSGIRTCEIKISSTRIVPSSLREETGNKNYATNLVWGHCPKCFVDYINFLWLMEYFWTETYSYKVRTDLNYSNTSFQRNH